MNTGVAKAGLGIKRPLVGTETFFQVQLLFHFSLLGIKRPLVGTETTTSNAITLSLSIRN